MFWKNSAWSWAGYDDDCLLGGQPWDSGGGGGGDDSNPITAGASPTATISSSSRSNPEPRDSPEPPPETPPSSSSSSSAAGPPEPTGPAPAAAAGPLVHLTSASACQQHPQKDGHAGPREASSHYTPQLTVNIVRGNDGFGFTICADCPARVQAVEPGGPAHRSGLQQGDSVLQLNGLPVEHWKCVDLANAIRMCSNNIVLIVWRGLPVMKPYFEGLIHQPTYRAASDSFTGRKLLSRPAHSKYGRRRGRVPGSGSGLRSGLGALGSLWRDRREARGEEEEEEDDEEEEEEEEDFSRTATTLKGTRVTSSNGDNYIILSPINPGSQLLQSVCHNRNATIGRLYQTHPNRGLHHHHHLHEQQQHPPLLHSCAASTSFSSCTMPPPSASSPAASASALQQAFSSCTLPSSSSSSALDGHGNYQNCTMVQSHLPSYSSSSGFGSYLTLTPKTLIFPVFVQPLDLCHPERTLLMSEEMILHNANLVPSKVTVLIYTDLLLLTREDVNGHCNVLQSPFYLKDTQLRETPSDSMQLYIKDTQRVVCLEAFTPEQKNRVTHCLHDNVRLQLSVSMETTRQHQQDQFQTDFGLLALSPDVSSSAPPLCEPVPFSSSSASSSPPFSSSSSSSHHPSYGASSPPSFLSSSPRNNLPCPAPPPPFVWKARERGGGEEREEQRRCRNNKERCGERGAREQRDDNDERLVWRERERRRRREEEEIWKERDVRREEVKEERQQGEGESCSEMSEPVGGGVCSSPLLLSPEEEDSHEDEEEEDDEEEEEEEEEGHEEYGSPVRTGGPACLRRSFSEGSLVREPRSPRFLSDSTIHHLTRPSTYDPEGDPRPPSPHTLRRELTREGGSLHRMTLLLYGKKDCGGFLQKRKKTKSLAKDVRSRLPFLRRRSNLSHGNNVSSLEKALKNHRPSAEEVQRWAWSFDALLANKYGLAVFHHFLKSEFSEENLAFWLAVEKYRKTRPLSKMAAKAEKIYNDFISTQAARQVNIDSSVRDLTNQTLCRGAGPASFQLAQDQIYSLMETDSYQRFLKSRLYAQLTGHIHPGSTATANQDGALSTHVAIQRRPVSVIDQC